MNSEELRMNNTDNGITLIALIITIIILLILAMVSINIAAGDGLIKKAQSATNTYTIEQEREQIQLAYADYRLAVIGLNINYTMQDAMNNQQSGATVAENEASGWTITFATTTGNIYTLSSDGEVTGPTNNSSTTK